MPSADPAPIQVTVAGSATDPRSYVAPPGIEVRHVPELHPDDVTVLDGLPVTTPARTLVDLAEVMDEAELRATFARARANGLLDLDAVRASRARVQWRPSLAMLDRVIADQA